MGPAESVVATMGPGEGRKRLQGAHGGPGQHTNSEPVTQQPPPQYPNPATILPKPRTLWWTRSVLAAALLPAARVRRRACAGRTSPDWPRRRPSARWGAPETHVRHGTKHPASGPIMPLKTGLEAASVTFGAHGTTTLKRTGATHRPTGRPQPGPQTTGAPRAPRLRKCTKIVFS